MSDLKKQDRPSTPRLEYTISAPDVQLMRDLLDGTRRMHDEYKTYIPKYPAEKANGYERRAKIAKVYGGLGRTLSASVGMLFAQPPARLDSWTPEFEEHYENIDGQGTVGDVFIKRRAEDAITDGFVGILVDFPIVPEGVTVTAANELTLNLRPLWKPYTRADILSWRTDVVDNVQALTQVVLREGAAEPLGKFGTTLKIQYRVCSLLGVADDRGNVALAAVWELLEEKKNDDGTIVVLTIGNGVFRDKSGAPFTQIPLAIIYAGRVDDTLCARPPLLDTAWANLEHWRVATSLRYYEELCCFPQPTVEGELAGDSNGVTPAFQTGPGVLVKTAPGSKFLWSEVKGTSLKTLRESLDEKKQEISELGASFLVKVTRGVQTAEAKRLDSAAENSTLATSAQGIEDGINQALIFHAQYVGVDAEHAPTITINRDFDTGSMDAPTMTAYVSAVAQAGLPVRVLLQAWQDGGRINPDVNLDQLEAEMIAGMAAAEQAKADALAAKNQPVKIQAPTDNVSDGDPGE